jgi:hypothetical protein
VAEVMPHSSSTRPVAMASAMSVNHLSRLIQSRLLAPRVRPKRSVPITHLEDVLRRRGLHCRVVGDDRRSAIQLRSSAPSTTFEDAVRRQAAGHQSIGRGAREPTITTFRSGDP